MKDKMDNQKRSRKRKLRNILIIVCALIVAAVLFMDALTLACGKRIVETADLDDGYDCILILGAGVRDDGSPTLMLADRLDQGLALYQQGAAPKIIVSGDHGSSGYDEVNTMKAYLVERGIPSEDVFMDHAGFSTYDSLYRARDIFQAQKLIIVTQKYHLYRALYIADRLDLDTVGVAADTQRYRGQFYRDMREIAARCKDVLQCVFMPEPALLGEVIPVFGNGDATND